MATVSAPPAVAAAPSLRRAVKVVRRNLLAYKHYWVAFITGFFEPFFYVVAVGFGVGQFIGTVPYLDAQLEYASFLAPGLLAASTLNGALFDGFFSPFFKLTYMKTYEGIITTPVSIPDIAVGEVLWATTRGSLYGAAFLLVMLALGLIHSPWALLALPAVVLSGLALSSGAMVLTGLARELSSLEKVMTLVVFPLFLFSGTFFPVSQYPGVLRPLVQLTPLYHSASLLRSLTTGRVDVRILVHVAYLAVMFVFSSTIAIRLMRRRLIS